MKKYLPNFENTSKGFTLIEMLVVITLIAILSAVGMTTYANVQKDARDARRKTDIDVIANAMEANYNTAGGTYKNFDPSTFITGGASALPTDPLSGTSRCGSGTPLNSRLCEYCGRNAVGTAITPGENLPSTCITGGAKVGSSVPVADTAFEVCATLENGTSGSRYYCRTNQR